MWGGSSVHSLVQSLPPANTSISLSSHCLKTSTRVLNGISWSIIIIRHLVISLFMFFLFNNRSQIIWLEAWLFLIFLLCVLFYNHGNEVLVTRHNYSYFLFLLFFLLIIFFFFLFKTYLDRSSIFFSLFFSFSHRHKHVHTYTQVQQHHRLTNPSANRPITWRYAGR